MTAQALTTVKVEVYPAVNYAPIVHRPEAHLFKKAWLDIKITYIHTGSGLEGRGDEWPGRPGDDTSLLGENAKSCCLSTSEPVAEWF